MIFRLREDKTGRQTKPGTVRDLGFIGLLGIKIRGGDGNGNGSVVEDVLADTTKKEFTDATPSSPTHDDLIDVQFLGQVANYRAGIAHARMSGGLKSMGLKPFLGFLDNIRRLCVDPIKEFVNFRVGTGFGEVLHADVVGDRQDFDRMVLGI